MIYKIFICFLSGIGAGLGTGFAGMSAAAVISPMLITFLGLPAYEAVGIALASDVLASAVSAYTYAKWLGDDGCCFDLYFGRKLDCKSCTQYYNGKFFCNYDLLFRYQIYC